MNTIIDGGPAFPTERFESYGDDAGHTTRSGGMSLRDWFAANASEQDINHWNSGWVKSNGREVVRNFSREESRYRFADAMLAARVRNLTTGT